MSDLYLRRNAVLEPLFNQWYAWSVLVSPQTAPMYVAHHCKIMQSFVSAPQVHVAAVKNPALLGGPFIAAPAERAPEVKRLLEDTLKAEAPALAFAGAIAQLHALLASQAAGFSLEPLYEKVPPLLRGYVELGYDLQNRPAYRFLEALLYRSPAYREAAQSVALWPLASDDRPFAFSTPRLAEPGRVELKVPFRHPGLDELVALTRTPAPLGAVKDLLDRLGAGDVADATLGQLFTADAPPAPMRTPPDGVRIRYFGHACLLIEAKGVAILTDPVISYDYPSSLPRYTVSDLPEHIDYVLITHAHADHLMWETLLQLRSRIGTIVVPQSSGMPWDPSMRLLLEHTGFRVRDLDALESIPVEGGAITGFPFLGEHGDLMIRSKLAYHVTLLGKSIVIGADSNAIEPRLYAHLHGLFGDVDALFLGMECEGAPMSWIYGPMMPTPLARKMDQTRRLDGSNYARAAAIVDLLRVRRVYVYAMGQEPWLNHVMALKYTEASPQIVQSNQLIEHCRAKGIVAERPFSQMDLIL